MSLDPNKLEEFLIHATRDQLVTFIREYDQANRVALAAYYAALPELPITAPATTVSLVS